LLCIHCFAQEEQADSDFDYDLVEVFIDTELDENSILFKPLIVNLSPIYLEYSYLLLIRKTNRKEEPVLEYRRGPFTLTPEEFRSLPRLEYARTPDIETIKVTLYIRDEDENKLIAKDSAEVKDLILDRRKRLDERAVVIRGIVVDETKTKVGSDFYNDFYSIYNQMPRKLEFVLSISELPYRGMTSIIQVKADQDLIYEFFTNPNEDYIRQQAQQTIRAIGRYIKNKETIKYEFNY